MLLRQAARAASTARPVVARAMSTLPDARAGLPDDAADMYDAALAFGKEEFLPHSARWDAESHFPVAELKKAAAQGFAGLYTAEDVGGVGLNRETSAAVFDALAQSDVPVTAYLSIHNMVNWVIDSNGSEEMRQRLLPKMVTMDRFSAYCLTEPGSGSDAAALRTTAVRDGDHYVLNGEKAFISCAGASGHGDDVMVVFCRTGGPGPKGITALMVEENYSEGISFGKNEHKMGWKAQPTRAVVFENVRVPVANVLGEENRGFRIAMQALNGGRVNIGACSVGSAQLAVEDTVAYVKERKMFGTTLGAMETTRHELSKLAIDVAASRLMVRSAARAIDENHLDKAAQCAAAKYFSTERCYDVVNRALQLHGGYGYLKDYPREQAVRDCRVHTILEGSSEVLLGGVYSRGMFE